MGLPSPAEIDAMMAAEQSSAAPVSASPVRSLPAPHEIEAMMAEEQRPTWGQSAKFVGSSLAEGAGNLMGLLADFNPLDPKTAMRMSGLGEAITGQPMQAPSQVITEARKEYIGTPEQTGITGDFADYTRAGLNALGAPIGGAIPNFLAGIGGEVAAKEFPESKSAPLIGALLTSAGIGAANKAANVLTKTGQAFERASVGANPKNYVASMKVSGLIDADDAENLSVRLKDSIEDISKTEGWGFWRDPATLSAKNKTVLDEVGSKIGSVLKTAEDAGAAPKVNLSDEGSAVQKLIASSKAEKAAVKDAIKEFTENFYHPENGWSGSLTDLNSWKSSIGKMAFSGTANGTLQPAIARKVQRAIYNDLQKAVADSVVETGVKKPLWDDLMKVYSRHADVAPMLDEAAARAMGESADKTVRGLLRTSGGTLTTPTIIGGAVAGGAAAGALPGLLLGAGLGLAGTNTGRGVLSKALQAAGAVGSKATQGAPLGALFESVVGNQPQSAMAAPALTQPATTEQTQEVPDMKLPKKFVDRISNAGLNFDELDPLDVAQIKAESSGVHTIEGPQTRYGRAKGLMQLLDTTGAEWHKKLGLEGKYDPFDAKQNLTIGKAYRDYLTDRYDGDVRLGLAAYNWGLGNLDKALKRTKSGTFEEVFTLMPAETRNYVTKIMKDVNGGVVSA